MDFLDRIGVFFLWVGGISLMLFFFSAIASQSNFNLLILGFIMILLGSTLWRRNNKAASENERFRILKSKQTRSSKQPKSGSLANPSVHNPSPTGKKDNQKPQGPRQSR
jgi:flagellar biosynthesis component FlhA